MPHYFKMLMKAARMGGQLPLIHSAAMKLADEILSPGPSFEEAAGRRSRRRIPRVGRAPTPKKMFLQAAGGAVQKFREKAGRRAGN